MCGPATVLEVIMTSESERRDLATALMGVGVVPEEASTGGRGAGTKPEGNYRTLIKVEGSLA